MTPEESLEELGIELPRPQGPVANYVSAVETGGLFFAAGAGPPPEPDGAIPSGKVGRDFTVEEGYEHARSVGLVQIARLKDELGDLGRVKRIVKLLAMVNCPPDSTSIPRSSTAARTCSWRCSETPAGTPGRPAA